MESAEYFVNNFRGMLAINYEQTAANIRKLRETKLKGMKQCEWQEIFDVSSPTANSWENLTKPKLPGLPRLCVMAKLFGVPLEEIIAVNDVVVEKDIFAGEEVPFYDTGRPSKKSTEFPKYENSCLKTSDGKPLSGSFEIDDGVTVRVKNGKLEDTVLENGEVLPAIETPQYYIEHWTNGMFVTSESIPQSQI